MPFVTSQNCEMQGLIVKKGLGHLFVTVKIIKNNVPPFQLMTEDPILNFCLCICFLLIIGFRNLVT